MMAMDGSTLGASAPGLDRPPALVCFSHLRRNSVFQRPQQLMARFALQRDVFFIEEAVAAETPRLRLASCPETGVRVVTPMLPDIADTRALRALLDQLLASIRPALAWYDTPLALAFSDHVRWRGIAFDVMDGLPALRHAPAELETAEARLMRIADVVFTGDARLHAAHAHRHPNIHWFPSGVDQAHFMAARGPIAEPADQLALPRPVLGYHGVIDERLDMALLAGMARLRPDWHFAMLGPVAKLRPEALPQAANIHWLGPKRYDVLPNYLAHWDVALMPFAISDATRFLSPTQVPEYLAGGKHVVSTPILNVESRYAQLRAVSIAADAAGFVAAAGAAMADSDVSCFVAVDDLLDTMSWDTMHDRMTALLGEAEGKRHLAAPASHARPAAMAEPSSSERASPAR